jgi:two-component system, chemotaxis family, protein-glutamate methylesterase/glutaminase
MQTRDIVVIGASMGGVEALSQLVTQLPAELPAAVLIVQHVAPSSPGLLSSILGRKGELPAVTAEDGMEPQRGTIYVAPPDRHLLMTNGRMRVVFGPRENRSRPAIDPLFRTAAVHYRSRVVGVVLTGLLSDGTSGLLAVHSCGGSAVVQSPDDASFPEMPGNALAVVPDAHQATLATMGALITRLTAEPAAAPPAVPQMLITEARLTERAMVNDDWNQIAGTPTNFTCPECNGAIQLLDQDGLPRFRCRVGHAYSSHDWLAEKGDAVEQSLWVALQSLEERAQMLQAMARDDNQRGWSRTGATFSERARETHDHATRLRQLLENLPR